MEDRDLKTLVMRELVQLGFIFERDACNNMDLVMHSGILAANNVLGQSHDLWGLIEQEKYLE